LPVQIKWILMQDTGTGSHSDGEAKSQSIDVVFGEIGAKADRFHDCEFKISEELFVYYGHQGGLGTESAREFLATHRNQAPSIGAATQADVPVSANSPDAF
jgi:hypothetical protein